MSDLNGNGFGDSHNWKNLGCRQWGTRGGPAVGYWECKDCGQRFEHYYHETPNIHDAMREQKVMDFCHDYHIKEKEENKKDE